MHEAFLLHYFSPVRSFLIDIAVATPLLISFTSVDDAYLSLASSTINLETLTATSHD